MAIKDDEEDIKKSLLEVVDTLEGIDDVGINGFVVGMNSWSFDKMIQETGLDKAKIKAISTWLRA